MWKLIIYMRKNEEENNKLYGGNSQQSDMMYNKGTKLLGFLEELWIII
jgi:hypothetical protein